MRIFIDGSDNPIFLSSGVEDYFLSAFYFDLGMFKSPNSGLTFYDGSKKLSAYKLHHRDPILFNDGMKLLFRNNEKTAGCGSLDFCPDKYCSLDHKNDSLSPNQISNSKLK